jgi:Domain of unknown function (DUF4105)
MVSIFELYMLSLKKSIFLILTVLYWSISGAQDSCQLRISLLTCTPGSELYSIFGHSAIRVIDTSTNTDIVYNYGTFDFGDPSFYSKFIRGKLLYYVSQENFHDFEYEYRMDNRGMDEQVLNLTCQEQHDIQQFLLTNLQGNNKFYKYDFLMDNCTTRLRDIIEQYANKSMVSGTIPEAKGMSFRNAIHYYLDMGHMRWSKLGIDLLLGSRIDRKMTNREAMFLPEFLEKSIDRSGSVNDSLVRIKLYPVIKTENTDDDSPMLTPFIVFSIVAMFIFLLGLMHQPVAGKILHITDVILFLLIGLLGCLIMFMWFGTDHRDTGNNFNLLWAWPTHVIAAVLLIFRKKRIPNYFAAYSIVTLLILVTWFFLPQQLNPSILPVLALACWRSWKIGRKTA